jgi:hypothetical protein
MKKNVGVLTGLGCSGRIATMLATLLLVMSLIGGVGAFTPVTELDELDDTLTVDFVLSEELTIKEETAARTGGRSVAVANRSVEQSIGLSSRGTVLASGQVVSMLRNSGIQRAVHPTGPPTVLA